MSSYTAPLLSRCRNLEEVSSLFSRSIVIDPPARLPECARLLPLGALRPYPSGCMQPHVSPLQSHLSKNAESLRLLHKQVQETHCVAQQTLSMSKDKCRVIHSQRFREQMRAQMSTFESSGPKSIVGHELKLCSRMPISTFIDCAREIRRRPPHLLFMSQYALVRPMLVDMQPRYSSADEFVAVVATLDLDEGFYKQMDVIWTRFNCPVETSCLRMRTTTSELLEYEWLLASYVEVMPPNMVWTGIRNAANSCVERQWRFQADP